MLTIEEFLNLKDWTFKLECDQGVRGDYHWIQSENLSVFLYDAIPLPSKPFRVLVAYWDCNSGAAYTYGRQSGWRAIGEDYALSEPALVLPSDLNHEADFAEMIIDDSAEIADDLVLSTMEKFFASSWLRDDKASTHFWTALEGLNAYCYWSGWGRCTYVMRGESLYNDFWQSDEAKENEQRYRQRTKAIRAKLWADVGPEVGPEKCVEPDCDRLRIRLAIRCFLHQFKSNRA